MTDGGRSPNPILDVADEALQDPQASYLSLFGLDLDCPATDAFSPAPVQSVAEIKAAAASLNKDDIPGFERLIRAAIGAKPSQVEAGQIVKAFAKSLGVDKAKVEQDWRHIEGAVKAENAPTQEEAEFAREAQRRECEAERSALYEGCNHIAENPNLLDKMVEVVGRMGVISERRGILASYIVATSRLHIRGAISLLRRGAAASGKNYLADTVFRLIPEESIVTAVGGSPKSLAYYGGFDGVDALKHKVVYVPEAAAIADRGGIENEFTTMLRVLISENRIVYHVVQTRENDPPITVTVTKNGPIAVIITSARDNIETEMMTRLMVADADESPGQTRAIIRNTLTNRENAISSEEIESWVDFQRWLELGGPYDVNIPFLGAIDRAFGDPAKAPLLRVRRDMEGFKRAIMASAIIHAARRKRAQDGRIVAEMRDYEVAHEAFDHDMGSLYGVNVPETAKAVVRAVEGLIAAERAKDPNLNDAKVTYDGLMAALGINSNDTARRRLKEAQRLGLIEQIEPPAGAGRTTPRRYRVLIPSSDLDGRNAGGVFPSPESVRENCTDYTDYTASSKGEGVSRYVPREPSSDDAQKGGEGVKTDGVVGVVGAASAGEPAATVRGVL